METKLLFTYKDGVVITTPVIKAMQRKKAQNDNPVLYIGTEVRNARLKSNLSLKEASFMICSLSYLCKIETNQLLPSAKFLSEICDRVALKPEAVNKISILGDYMRDCVLAFVLQDKEMVDKIYEETKCLTNHAAKLLALYKSIYDLNIPEAVVIYKDIEKVIRTLPDNELNYFTMASVMLHYIKGEFVIAKAELESLSDDIYSRCLDLLYRKYKYLIAYSLNACDTTFLYQDLVNSYIKYHLVDQLTEINYVQAIYYAKNKCDAAFNDMLMGIRDAKLRNSACFIYCLYNDKSLKDPMFNDNSLLTNYVVAIKKAIGHCDDYSMELAYNPHNAYIAGEDLLSLEYLAIDNVNEKLDFIMNVALPRLHKTNEKFLIEYFMNELNALAINECKYKVFTDAYSKFIDKRVTEW